MKIGTFSIKIWRWFSMLMVFGALVWTYSVFPEQIAFDFAASGLAEIYVNKEHLFYIVMAFFVLNNVVLSAFARQIPKIDASHFPIPKKNIWAQHREELNEHLINWLYTVVSSINTIIALSLLALATINSSQYNLTVFDFAWVSYVGLALMILIFLLPLRLLKTPVPKEEDTY
ncbi:hypothetical protein L0657_20440 [Dyadobacter sp. CY345]|uniref:hypothetical protein n=1 Tax=Dyadobacter sp. CY345 TaxID=2909335 RepID=UPI001F20280E|nr:hypothetical protein [Dyadobacter sp. CY345]MCF2446339.1 hypothetical protein [Dyadobacter sp. CY345]